MKEVLEAMKNTLFYLSARRILKISGPDRFDFLQGLITQDIFLLKTQKAIYAGLLNSQGRYLHDFFIYNDSASKDILLDELHNNYVLLETDHRVEELLKLFKLYKLRRQVDFEIMDTHVYCDFSKTVKNEIAGMMSFDDPRAPGLWQRVLSDTPLNAQEDLSYYHYERIKHCLPESEMDLIVGRTFPLEAGLERMNAINFKKGCYIGQEPVARAHYQGVIRKKIMTVRIEGDIPPYGSKIVTENGANVGDLRSTVSYNNENIGVAMIRTEAALERLHCDTSSITIVT